MTDLLPCPFCGGEAVGGYYAYMHHIKCNNCAARVTVGENEPSNEVIKKWNTRWKEKSMIDKAPVFTLFENDDAELMMLLLSLLKKLLVGVSEGEALIANTAANRLLAKYGKAVSTPETVKEVWNTRCVGVIPKDTLVTGKLIDEVTKAGWFNRRNDVGYDHHG